MKFQDLTFLFVFLTVLWLRNSRISALVGLICLIGAIPLFATWTFFTAERLTWYAAAFFLLATMLNLRLKVFKF